MKNALLFFSVFQLYAFNSSAQTIVGREAESKIPGAKMIQYSERSSRPEFIEFSESAVYRNGVEDPAETIRKILNFSEEEQLIIFKQTKDEIGFTHTRYRQYYKHVPVEGAEYIAHEKSGGLDCINGLTFKLNNIPVTTVLNEAAALKKAIAYVGAKKYMWDETAHIAELREIFENSNFNFNPTGNLVIYPKGNNFVESSEFRLAYKFNIYASEPESRANIFVDARTGEIIGSLDLIHTADVKGTAVTMYSGTRDITADQNGSTYRLQEAGRGNGIVTKNAKRTTNAGSAVDFTDTDNNWNNVNATVDQAATDAHWATELTYDFYKKSFNYNSIDNSGMKLLNYVHWDNNLFNAYWNGQYMAYGDGSQGNKPLTAIDVGAHEMTHGLTEKTAGLQYKGESGALNESFSDIFGACVENFGKGKAGMWTIGEDFQAIRNMKDPSKFTDPDTYQGTYWASTTGADNGGVHTNSGVQNKWFYILTEGESGTNDKSQQYNVTGIGPDKAIQITFRNLTEYLTSSSNYVAARTGALKAATDLYGDCSAEYVATMDAWYAVGVGAKSNCVVAPTANFTANTTTSCDGKIQFTDKSSAAPTSWSWDFGDGQTSTVQNPLHTYSASGTFTIKLTATNANGTDSEIKSSYVTVNILTAPTVTSGSRCDVGVVNLSASVSSGTIQWYSAATGGTLVNTGNTYSPNLSTTTTFYVESSTSGAIQKVGPADAAIGASGLHTANADAGLLFDVLAPCILKTVKVIAGAAGDRTIEVLNAKGGTILKTTTVNLPAGESRVTLNFDLPAGTQYFIKVSGSLVDLTRNSAGAVYPYTSTGLLSITASSSTSAGYYYYFYDWEVQSAGCSSTRVPVTATINPAVPKPIITLSGLNQLTAPQGYTYQWYLNGNSIAGATGQTYIPLANGDYKVEVTASPGCSAMSDVYTINNVGVENIGALASINMYPNPTKGIIYIESPETGNTINIKVYSLVGDVVYKETYNTFSQVHKIDLSALSDGVYFVKLQIGSDFATVKITLNH